uniref:EF-hand domain-containing protein n=1 Tax=Hemiselmis andersenii TaxID=464988 RepID=A0A6T8N3M1_HEMAN|mmetsp:Transcript_3427/g.7916  ORF Transcript_3427/g.7916 Transcript_3427/m.7916 type:complete len:145 (-) Transcript_3427:154-588(-)
MAELLEESQMQELSKVFRTFDLQTKGTLDTRELGACFRCFGYVATEADLADLVNEVGGTVDFAQFVHIMQKKMKDCDPIAEMTAAFKAIDADSDGQISKSELKDVFAMLMGFEPTAVEVDELMREADVDGDGRISQLDFVNVLS